MTVCLKVTRGDDIAIVLRQDAISFWQAIRRLESRLCNKNSDWTRGLCKKNSDWATHKRARRENNKMWHIAIVLHVRGTLIVKVTQARLIIDPVIYGIFLYLFLKSKQFLLGNCKMTQSLRSHIDHRPTHFLATAWKYDDHHTWPHLLCRHMNPPMVRTTWSEHIREVWGSALKMPLDDEK